MGSFMPRAHISFHSSVNPVSFTSQNRGRLMTRIQKVGANMQSLKKEGKHVVRDENYDNYARQHILWKPAILWKLWKPVILWKLWKLQSKWLDPHPRARRRGGLF